MDDIRIEHIKTLRGPNIWAPFPVLEVLLDMGQWAEASSDTMGNVTRGVREALPTITGRGCEMCGAERFGRVLETGTALDHIIQHVIVELETLAGMETTFGRTEQASHPSLSYVLTGYRDAEAAKGCVRLAVELVRGLAVDGKSDLELSAEIENLRNLAQANMLGPSTLAVVREAEKRDIPWIRLNAGSLVQLGHGRYSKRIRASATSLTPSISSILASDKEMTKTLLARCGVPVPQGEVVEDEESAWRVAQALDGPVVVKPLGGNQGRGVSVNLTTENHVKQAFVLARDISRVVIVERFYEGEDYRLLVVGRKLVAAALRKPPQVTGDGRYTIERLVEIVNTDLRRGNGHGAALTRIRLDGAAELTLAKQGLNLKSVPDPGQVVLLRDNSNLSTGGTAVDVTSEVHPDNATLAVLAARTIGLDVAGVDIVCKDISGPMSAQGGGVVEVNAAPGLRMHLYPSEGKARPVGAAIVNMLFPRRTRSRIPLIAVTGTNGKTTVTRMIAHVFARQGRFVGMALTDGIYFGGVRRLAGDCSGPRSAELVLQHPDVEVAVLETARGGILRSGLGWDGSSVSVALNIANDHLGISGIDTLEQLARIKRVVLENVRRDGSGVLNADDPHVAAMASHCPGTVIFFGMDKRGPVISSHIAGGGRAVYLSKEGSDPGSAQIVLADGGSETVLMQVGDIPATLGGLVSFQTQNALAAVAACWASGLPLEMIQRGLATFHASSDMAPGRFNMFRVNGAQVIADYGHNAHAHRAIQAAIRHLRPRRTIGVFSSPGDRRDADVRELASVAAGTFDRIILYEGDKLRGREPGEIQRVIAEAVRSINPGLPILICSRERDAVARGLELAQPDDLLFINVANVEESLAQIQQAASNSESE